MAIRLLWICYDAINWSCNFTAETEPHEGKRKVESLWPIFRLHHQRSRYIFDLFYKRKAISRGMVVGYSLVAFVSMRVVKLWFSFAELYDYCIREGYADKNLIAKWKKQGYENLCCLRCIQTRDTNFGTNCICRVPKGKLEVVSCVIYSRPCTSVRCSFVFVKKLYHYFNIYYCS